MSQTPSVEEDSPIERTAVRLLRSSVDRSYHPEVDVDWDAPDVPGLRYVPDRYISLYGTKIFERMTEEEKIRLGRLEASALASWGILAESALMHPMLKLASVSDPRSATAQYALTEVADECRHSVMFGRQINTLSDRSYNPPMIARALVGITALAPLSATIFSMMLMVEEILDRLQRQTMNDETLQPRTRAIAKIHVIEEARHISYARVALARAVERTGRGRMALERLIVAAGAAVIPLIMVQPAVYRDAGLPPLRSAWTALRNPHYHANLRFFGERLVRVMNENDMLEGRLVQHLWRWSRMLPEDFVPQSKRTADV
ncbi:membrane protein [Mycobacteroides abscessus]|uniref:AurF N-oxygenase family protein n=1 Tax=Mycobacteroides abscessus TaxID=36809 RepID=UPI0002EDF6EA|nr:diiron oxygenase [Mycobacteroides abscessus]CPT35130.1 membrane protein [Mycobacteroides abscessus]CPU37682.1 membrane protein [Mycobacteroides abscessus]SKJ79391.1 membrane protein [Mycobacteroides abscessus subsp. massiliense]SKP99480.1 membrane protein [Mycobacteroides abscessus subsp. massiliense]SKV29984.1 membrane protein [Mycobacteroides abscessus subsp. massiliense]